MINRDLSEIWDLDNLRYENWTEFAPYANRATISPGIIIPMQSVVQHPVSPANAAQSPSLQATITIESNLTPTTQEVVIPPLQAPEKPLQQPIPEVLESNQARILYFYQLEDSSFFDRLYGENRGSKIKEKPISVHLLGEGNGYLKLDNRPFVESGVGIPVAGSKILDPATERWYKVVECDIARDHVLVQVELG